MRLVVEAGTPRGGRLWSPLGLVQVEGRGSVFMPGSQKTRLGSSPQPHNRRNGATGPSTTDHSLPPAVHAIRVPTRGQTKK